MADNDTEHHVHRYRYHDTPDGVGYWMCADPVCGQQSTIARMRPEDEIDLPQFGVSDFFPPVEEVYDAESEEPFTVPAVTSRGDTVRQVVRDVTAAIVLVGWAVFLLSWVGFIMGWWPK